MITNIIHHNKLNVKKFLHITYNKTIIIYCYLISFCTHKKTLEIVRKFTDSGIDITPILSENVCNISTRFGRAEDFINNIENITKNKIIRTIEESEKIGPNRSFEVLIIAPCTGNTLAKLSSGITDTNVTK